MPRKPEFDTSRLNRILQEQHSVVSRAQVFACGMSRTAVQVRIAPSGPWQRVLPGVYLAVTGGGLFYANPRGVMSKYGDGVTLANGIILSPDEKTLYVTNGAVVLAFDVQQDGSLKNQRELGKLRGGQGGDGSAVDSQGRVYVATGQSADVFAPSGEFLGSIKGPQGMHGVAFGGQDKKTLFGIVFYGGWGTPSARNRVVAIPMIAQGYTGRAK